MMKLNHTRLCASAAIAAALALTSTPLLAQFTEAPISAAPEPVLIPETWSPPPPQPAIVLPTELPQTTSAPTTIVAPDPAPVRTTTTTRTRTVAPSSVTRTTVAAPADPAPVSVADDSTPVSVEILAEPVAPITVSEPVATEAPADNGGAFQFGLIALAAIAAFVLAIWGFIAIGRRKPADRKAAVAIVQRPVVAPRAPRHAPLIVEPAYAAPLSAVHAIATPAPSVAHSGAAVPLPRRLPETFAERDALLKRMIAAQPDRANPFSTYKARLKRARLILQSLGHEFAHRKPWIDLSQYPGNWPEQSRSNYAAA